MATGNRCVIYDDIDALSEARTVADLVRRLKPILSELAYYGVTGETAVLEAHEEWRSQYTDRLRDETPQPAAPPGAAGGHSSHGGHGSHGGHSGSSRSEPAFTEPPRTSTQDSRTSARPAARPASREQFSASGHGASTASSRTGTHQRSMQNEDSDPMPMRANSGIYTPGRVNSTGVPRALLAIMSGTHPSLKD